MTAYGMISDEELTALLKQGDRESFAEIFSRYNGLLYTHAYKKLGSKEDAKDIVQDVFVKLWNAHERMGETSNLIGYLYTMMRNAIFTFTTHQGVVRDYATAFNRYRQEGELITDHLVRENEFKRIIEQEIAALPPRMREVFELSKKEHLSNKEIAERMGISELTVADQLKKAKKQLRSKLGLMVYLALLMMH